MTAVRWLLQAAADVPAGDGWLAPDERTRLAGMRAPARRADWRLGRWTAKRAVAGWLAAQPAPAAVEVRSAADGAPEVLVDGAPAPLVISLSHRAGLAVCMVAAAGVALGCDLELVEPRSDAFVADYLTAAERAAVQAAPVADRPLLVALHWSAKESALKALRTGLRLDTRWVAVDPPQAGEPGRWNPLTVRHPATGRAFHGWWRHDAGRVLTMVAAPQPAPPLASPLGR
jgi:4'-phosphopantetheinyl transferase